MPSLSRSESDAVIQAARDGTALSAAQRITNWSWQIMAGHKRIASGSWNTIQALLPQATALWEQTRAKR